LKIYERCAPYVYSVVKSYIFEEAYRRDAMQEVFAQVFSSLNRYNSKKGNFKPWISQIAVNQCISILRKSKKFKFLVSLPVEKEFIIYDDLDLDAMSRKEVKDLLENMPLGYRTVFLLSVIDEYSHKEIGQMLSISESTSRSQLSRAISWLRKNSSDELKNLAYG